MNILNSNIYLIGLISLILSIIVGRILYKSNIPTSLFDQPDKRKIHKTPTALLGGITIIFSTIQVIIFFKLFTDAQIQLFIIFSLYFFFVGFFDDLFRMKYLKKLIFQILGVILFLSAALPNLSILTFSSFSSDHIILNYILIILWLLFVINAFNFFDGVNFLAGSLAIIFFSSYAIAYNRLDNNIPVFLLTILIFSTLGFLIYNRAPAKMFLGDAGSLFLGFTIAAFPIIFDSNTSNSLDLTFPVIITFLLISDTIFVLINRIINRKNPFSPDKTHIHHQLLNLHFRTRYIVILILVGTILHSILGFYSQNLSLIWLVICITILNILFIILPRFLPYLFFQYKLWGLKNIYDKIINLLKD